MPLFARLCNIVTTLALPNQTQHRNLEHLDGSGEEPCGGAFDGSFEVFGEAAVSVQPRLTSAERSHWQTTSSR